VCYRQWYGDLPISCSASYTDDHITHVDLKQLLLSIHFRRFLPIVAGAMKALPEPVLEWLNPALGTFFKLDHKVTALCAKALEKGSPDPQLGQERTIFDALTDASVPPQEKTLIRLKDESILVLFAGLDTNGRFLSAMLCYMLTYPAVLAKLRSELESAVQTLGKPLSWIQLEQLPYLVSADRRLETSPAHYRTDCVHQRVAPIE
jgi:hypothetical protein